MAHVATLGALMAVTSVGCDKKKDPPPTTPQKIPAEPQLAATDSAAKPGPAYPPNSPVFGEMNVPGDNPMTAEKVKLGHQLFFDPRMSASGKTSCYSCHRNEFGTGGQLPIAVKDNGKSAGRHAPVMWNIGFLPALYWDGRARSLEEQGLATWATMLGVGKANLPKKAAEIASIPGYKSEFEKAFPGQPITPELIIKAIATYERTLVCDNTAFDQFRAGNTQALNPKQKAGYKLFMGKAGCTSCHTIPFFSDAYTTKDGAYHNTGVGTSGPADKLDIGRKKVTGLDSQWAAFKTPSLRNAVKSAPYFHDGSRLSLREAVKLMATGGVKNPALDAQLKNRNLTDKELTYLTDFLGSLECPEDLEKPDLPK